MTVVNSTVNQYLANSSGVTSIQDTAANVSANLGSLATGFGGLFGFGGSIVPITLTDAGTPTLVIQAIDAADVSNNGGLTGAYLVINQITGNYDLAYNLAAFEPWLEGGTGTLSYTYAADSSGVFSGSISVTTLAGSTHLTYTSDGTTMSETLSGTPLQISGAAGHAATLELSHAAANYTLTPVGDGASFEIGVEKFSNVTALKFSDLTEIVAATPGDASHVTSGNITELYSAVLAREPDVAGLAFYESFLSSHLSTPLQQFATWFLSSTEYKSAHAYAQTPAGDTQFIQDSYQNLLHRVPTADEVSFYESKVLAPAVANFTGGTDAYAAAQLQAHALMLVYFSASPEFLADVQVTPAHPANAQHWLNLI